MPKDNNKIIKQFHLYKEKNANNLPASLLASYLIYKYISYTKKQKLAFINCVTNIWKIKPDQFIELITKYSTIANLGIIIIMF